MRDPLESRETTRFMWHFLTSRRPWPFGLDIAADGIRMLQFHPVGARIAVCAGAQWKSPTGSESDERSLAAAVHAVREIHHEGGFQGFQAVSTIPTSEMRIETLRLPNDPSENLQAEILRRAHDLFDMDLSRFKLSALRSGAVLASQESCREWILLATPHEVCQRRTEFLEAMGLEVYTLQPEPLSLFDSIRRQHRRCSDHRSAHAMVHLSQASTLVVVAHAEQILLVKNIGFGGDRLTATAADNLGLEFDEANLLRRQIRNDFALHAHQARMTSLTAGEPDSSNAVLWTVHDAIRDEVEALVMEIGLCMRYCSNTFGTPRIENVTLAGDGAWDPSIIHLLKDHLGVRCEGASPLRAMDVSECPLFGDRRRSMADWTLCAGLAGHLAAPVTDGIFYLGQPMESILLNSEGTPA